MTKADIVDEIAERTGLTKKDVADTVDQFLDAVSRALASGKHIEIRGFGTFKVKDRKSRLARNPRTGESVPVPPRRIGAVPDQQLNDLERLLFVVGQPPQRRNPVRVSDCRKLGVLSKRYGSGIFKNADGKAGYP